ncbi:hydrogen peroxide-inducible genes activator [Frigidibacter sp. MR17.24]|uniref:hydrogen peroxide-inducible genes activator n=1 Tax=Frigidibacter sp. MR17.24 TaxID=3127345 RepID=UPI003012E294
MKITLRQLSYLQALAEAGHFGRAAARVNVSQPALSVQIRELEAALGLELVERQPRAVRLTRAGRAVLERAGRILHEVAELEAEARRGALGGVLTLGVIPTLAPYLMPSVLAALPAPGIAQELRLREAQTAVLLDDLGAGRLDAVVIATPPGPDAVERVLFADRFLLAGREGELARLAGQVERLRPVTVDPEELLLLDEGHCLADQALEVCGIGRRRARIDLGASSLGTLCALVAGGMGFTLVPETAAPAELRAQPAMRVARFAAPEPERLVRLVVRAGVADEPWVTALAALLGGKGRSLTGQPLMGHPVTGHPVTGQPVTGQAPPGQPPSASR